MLIILVFFIIVANDIIEEIQVSRCLDSTPDASNTDQLSFVIRYVRSNGEPVERFWGFIENVEHNAESLSEVIFSHLRSLLLILNFYETNPMSMLLICQVLI